MAVTGQVRKNRWTLLFDTVGEWEMEYSALSHVREWKLQSYCPSRAEACFVHHLTLVQTMGQIGLPWPVVVLRFSQLAARGKRASPQARNWRDWE